MKDTTNVIFTSVAAASGGSSAFAWMSQILQTKWFPEVSDEYVVIARNWTWIIVAISLAVFHILYRVWVWSFSTKLLPSMLIWSTTRQLNPLHQA
jgi:hypothetical protein